MALMWKASSLGCLLLSLQLLSVAAQHCPTSDLSMMPEGNFSALSLLQQNAAVFKAASDHESDGELSSSGARRRGGRRRRKKQATTTKAPKTYAGGDVKTLEKQLDEVTGDVKQIGRKVDIIDGKIDKLADRSPQPAPPAPPAPQPPPPKEDRHRRRRRDKKKEDSPSPSPSPAPGPASGGGEGTPGKVPESEPDRWVNAHNYYRCLHDAPPIHWDKDFARGAQKWADRGQMSHAKCYKIPPPEGPAGENLAGGSSISIEQASHMWWDENPQNAPRCGGHCTAMLWKAATKLGCGIAPGGMGKLMVCRYGGGDPLPNFGGDYEGQVGRLDKGREDECKKKWPMAKDPAAAGGGGGGGGGMRGGMGGMHGGMGGMRGGMRGGMGGMRGGMGGMRGGMGGMRGGMGGMHGMMGR